jgi:deoxyribodipyrimidine photolyase-related protein
MTVLIIIFPHQLFGLEYIKNILLLDKQFIIVLWEHDHFFSAYPFHKLKLAFHKASIYNWIDIMKKSFTVIHIESITTNHKKEIVDIINNKKNNITEIRMFDPIEKELQNTFLNDYGCIVFPSPYFLSTTEDNKAYISDGNAIMHSSFYKNQRIVNNILVNNNNSPYGTKWSFDTENRLTYPKDVKSDRINQLNHVKHSKKREGYINKAIKYVTKHYKNNYGECLLENFIYPINHEEAYAWLDDFIKYKLENFGKYEDAIHSKIPFGYHSLLSALTNIGLITPHDIITAVTKKKDFVKKNLSSVEGFIRQVVGWREYCFLIYSNFNIIPFYSNNKKTIPKKFWEGKTLIPIIDDTIAKINKYAYCHHIERLMVMGNFLLVIGVHPKYIYDWFQTMFIDSYDWVMIPNVYGMLLYGYIDKKNNKHMMTRPYICSSNYLKKMSNYKDSDGVDVVAIINGGNGDKGGKGDGGKEGKGDKGGESKVGESKVGTWGIIMDALYYNLINTYMDDGFDSIYSVASSVKTWKKFPNNKKKDVLNVASLYIKWLWS